MPILTGFRHGNAFDLQAAFSNLSQWNELLLAVVLKEASILSTHHGYQSLPLSCAQTELLAP